MAGPPISSAASAAGEDRAGTGCATESATENADALLLRVGRGRDRRAFVALFHLFAPRLKAFLCRGSLDAGLAEEIIQEVMVVVWRKADSFDPARASAATWIYTIARNRRIDRLRQERRPEIDPDDPALVPEPEDAADFALMREDDRTRLHQAIDQLPPDQSDLLRMAYFEDKPHSAIAAERQLPLGTVKSRLRLALVRLRTLLGDEA